MTDRAHLYKPVVDTAGNVVPNVSVSLLQPGSETPITEDVFTGATGTNTFGSTFNCPSGIIDVYLAAPKRLRVKVTAAGASPVYFENVDVLAISSSAPSLTSFLLTSPGGATYEFSTDDNGYLQSQPGTAPGSPTPGPSPAPAPSGGSNNGIQRFYVFDQNSAFSDINSQTIALHPSDTAPNTFTENTDPTVFQYIKPGTGFSNEVRILKPGYCTFGVWVDLEQLPADTILTLFIYNGALDDHYALTFRKGQNITSVSGNWPMIYAPTNSSFRAQIHIDSVAGSALQGVTSTYNCSLRCSWMPA